MCTADCKQIVAGPYEGIQRFCTFASKREEIILQEQPNDDAWDIWRRFLHHHFIHTNRDIKIPLGCWLIDFNEMKRLAVFYNTMIHFTKDGTNIPNTTTIPSATKACAIPPDNPTYRHTPNDMISSLPFDAVPCDITMHCQAGKSVTTTCTHHIKLSVRLSHYNHHISANITNRSNSSFVHQPKVIIG